MEPKGEAWSQLFKSSEYFNSPEYRAACAREDFLLAADPADLSDEDRKERAWLINCAYSRTGSDWVES
jgi:hypothetical protein